MVALDKKKILQHMLNGFNLGCSEPKRLTYEMSIV